MNDLKAPEEASSLIEKHPPLQKLNFVFFLLLFCVKIFVFLDPNIIRIQK
jgi:hypothetical protein